VNYINATKEQINKKFKEIICAILNAHLHN
jgi:hypothetical protein